MVHLPPLHLYTKVIRVSLNTYTYQTVLFIGPMRWRCVLQVVVIVRLLTITRLLYIVEDDASAAKVIRLLVSRGRSVVGIENKSCCL